MVLRLWAPEYPRTCKARNNSYYKKTTAKKPLSIMVTIRKWKNFLLLRIHISKKEKSLNVRRGGGVCVCVCVFRNGMAGV